MIEKIGTIIMYNRKDVIIMENTPLANRLHIAIFGRRNAGKSSLINALTNQNLALVSSVAGTTADPVYKSMELLPLGPVVMIDTAGIDDVGELGELRIQKTIQVLNKTDLAILVIDPETGITEYEQDLIAKIKERKIPLISVVNKIDQYPEINIQALTTDLNQDILPVSAVTNIGIDDLKLALIKIAPKDTEPPIIGDLIQPGDTVILVCPIDSAAPKGRLILPQVQTLRDLLDHDAMGLVTKETELELTLKALGNSPAMVVTDSQAFGYVSPRVPTNIPVTGFSILFARQKGDLPIYVKGAKAISSLLPGDKVLIAEACTHHRQPEDIGTVKIPNWLEQRVGDKLEFHHVAGREFPENLKEYKLIVQCGGCMTNRKDILYRLHSADRQGVPIVNYGILIAYIHNILDRALEVFPDVLTIWNK